jgi:predicted HTH domain antitoxin
MTIVTTLTIDLPESVLADLQQSLGEAERDVRLAAAIEWYRRGALSQGRAAEIAGISRADFIDALADRHIDVIEVDLEEVRRESGVD